MTLPKLPRQQVRPEKEIAVDVEIWYPDWRCFCCHDTGIVRPRLVELVIPDYDHDKDFHPVCYRCDAGKIYANREEYDQRLTRSICGELDRIERENWTVTVKEKQQRILETKLLAQQKSLRLRDRTPDEETIAQNRHQQICDADPQVLQQMAREYLGDNFWQNGSS